MSTCQALTVRITKALTPTLRVFWPTRDHRLLSPSLVRALTQERGRELFKNCRPEPLTDCGAPTDPSRVDPRYLTTTKFQVPPLAQKRITTMRVLSLILIDGKSSILEGTQKPSPKQGHGTQENLEKKQDTAPFKSQTRLTNTSKQLELTATLPKPNLLAQWTA